MSVPDQIIPTGALVRLTPEAAKRFPDIARIGGRVVTSAQGHVVIVWSDGRCVTRLAARDVEVITPGAGA